MFLCLIKTIFTTAYKIFKKYKSFVMANGNLIEEGSSKFPSIMLLSDVRWCLNDVTDTFNYFA